MCGVEAADPREAEQLAGYAEAIQEQCLSAVSRCDHPLVLADYGFIDAKVKMKSIVAEADVDPAFAHTPYDRVGQIQIPNYMSVSKMA